MTESLGPQFKLWYAM